MHAKDRSTDSCTTFNIPTRSSYKYAAYDACRTWRDIAPAIQPDSNQAEKGIRFA